MLAPLSGETKVGQKVDWLAAMLAFVLDETMVVLATEFGRTPKINENDGRDHSPTAFSCVLAGGGVRGICYLYAPRRGERRR